MTRLRRFAAAFAIAGVVMGAAPESSAQARPSKGEWQKGTTLAVFGGAVSSTETRPSLGGSVGWEILPHLTIDGSGVWTVPHNDASMFSALLGGRFNLTHPARAVPFASAAVGFHSATFDSTTSPVPDFYRRRMADPTGTRSRFTFDDFVYSFGGGMDVFVRRHVAVRGDVRVLFVTDGSNTRTETVYGIHLAYHFEEHVITP